MEAGRWPGKKGGRWHHLQPARSILLQTMARPSSPLGSSKQLASRHRSTPPRSERAARGQGVETFVCTGTPCRVTALPCDLLASQPAGAAAGGAGRRRRPFGTACDSCCVPGSQVCHRCAVQHLWRVQRQYQRWRICLCLGLGLSIVRQRPLGKPGILSPAPARLLSALCSLPPHNASALPISPPHTSAPQVAAFEGPPDATGAPRPEALGTFSAGSCADVPPPGPYTCAQQAGWGRCNDQYYKQNKFCAVTCGFCGSGGYSPSPSPSSSGRRLLRGER